MTTRCCTTDLTGYGHVVQHLGLQLLSACPLMVLYNMSVAGVRVVEFGTYQLLNTRTEERSSEKLM